VSAAADNCLEVCAGEFAEQVARRKLAARITLYIASQQLLDLATERDELLRVVRLAEKEIREMRA